MAGQYDARFEALVTEIIEDEGGYVNHPKDKGGPTKFGITIPFLAEARGVTRSEITDEMIKKLTLNDARIAYHKVIWQGDNLKALPSEIQRLMFDWMVMSGSRTPVKFLQRRVDAHPDGFIGPKTVAAVRASFAATKGGYEPWEDKFVNEIIRFLIRIAKRDTSQTVFLEGWFNRFALYYGQPLETTDADGRTSSKKTK